MIHRGVPLVPGAGEGVKAGMSRSRGVGCAVYGSLFTIRPVSSRIPPPRNRGLAMVPPSPRLDYRRRRLAGRYWPLARKLAGPFKERWPRLADEFDSAAAIALVACAARYRGGVNFATYARPRLAGAMLDVLRRAGRAGRIPIDRRDGADHQVADPREGPDAEAAAREALSGDRDRVEAILGCLSPRQRRIVRLIALRGLTTREAARRVGLAQSRVVELHGEAMAELRRIAGPGSR